MEPKIKQNWFIDRFLDLVGFINRTRILGYTVSKNMLLVRRGCLTAVLIAHELVHVDQIKKLGQFRMMYRYFMESIRHGYRNNCFEIEAYTAQNQSEYQRRARQMLIKLRKK